MKLHSLLERQLKRLALSELEPPKDRAIWNVFLERVNKSYIEADQDRDLNEHSQEIASREMQLLYDRLSESQKIAHLGSWFVSVDKNQVHWSDETFKIFNRDPSLGHPSYEEACAYIYAEDIEECKRNIKLALEQGKEYEHDFRILVDNQPHWVHSIGKPNFDAATGKYNSLSGAIMSIDKQKKTEATVKKLNQQLVLTARRAGMEEVTTSVLHNIGNIMNSVNVASNALLERLNETKFSGLVDVSQLIKAHQDDFKKFILSDPQGQNLIAYIEKIPEFWETRKAMLLQEINEIINNVKNIKDIISAQQVMSGAIGTFEEIFVKEIIEESVRLYKDNFFTKNIDFIFECNSKICLLSDRVKFLQILVNLVKNAYESVMASNTENKQIKIIVKDQGDNYVCVKIFDNGTGIKKENLEKIFSHGFTTKKNGHGFGLHASAISAYELGGSLKAESEGESKGCVFTLLLPKKPKRRKEDINEHNV